MKDKSLNQLRKTIRKKMSKPTQTELSRTLGFTQSYLSKVLRGKRTPKNLKEILETVNREIGR
jgi:transcriptional regulator with XRE-family HTH domain